MELEHEKCEARENRAVDEIDRMQKDRDETGSTEKLDEAYQEQQHLLEKCQTENEELKAELNLLQIKLQRLEQCNMEGSEKDIPRTTMQPSSALLSVKGTHTPELGRTQTFNWSFKIHYTTLLLCL